MSLFNTLSQKPWLPSQERIDNDHSGRSLSSDASRVGFFVLITTIATLFSLLSVAYIGRMAYGDWRVLPEPAMLWVNTFILFLSSVFFQKAKNFSNHYDFRGARIYLILAGLLTLIFLFGQIAVWKTLVSYGYFLSSNPSFAFFYLLTGLHMVHLLGGLSVWGFSVYKTFNKDISVNELRSTISLSTMYWHFLLIVWIFLFGLLLAT